MHTVTPEDTDVAFIPRFVILSCAVSAVKGSKKTPPPLRTPFTVTIVFLLMQAGYVVIKSFIKVCSNMEQHPSDPRTQVSEVDLTLKQNGDESAGVDQTS